MPKIKNIIIFVVIGAVFVLIYIFFIKAKPKDEASLVSTGGIPAISNSAGATATANATATTDFLNLLLSVKNIKLNDVIFSDKAFTSLHDSSITLIPDGNEGRINPFAPFGADSTPIVPLNCVAPQVLDPLTDTCVNPALTCILPKILNPLTNTCVNQIPH